MEVKYLKSYEANKTGLKLSKLSDPIGLTEDRIVELEAQINEGRPFPKAFKEFLLIGGDFGGLGIDPVYDCEAGDGVEYVEAIRVHVKLMNEIGASLDRPFVIFNADSGSTFDFIYLDEGDDPRPRYFSLDASYLELDDGQQIVDFPEVSFSALIARLVAHRLKGWTPY